MNKDELLPNPVMIKYARQFYDALAERAELNEGGELVFTGKLLEVFHSLGVAQKYYTTTRRIFKLYECVRYIERGTKAYDSVLVLLHPPPDELPPDVIDRLTNRERAANVEDVARRVSALEDWRESLTMGGTNISAILRNFEKRLAKLESKGTNAKKS